ncbi:hypothetical protein [Planifilum fimeticola]|jgi:hypothetical protein
MSQSKVWRYTESSWIYRFIGYDINLLNQPENRRRWIIKVALTILDILQPFATIYEVEVGTLSEGEDAFVISGSDENYQEKLVRYLKNVDDVTEINFLLTLHCYEVEKDQKPQEILFQPGGALYLFIELDETRRLKSSSDQSVNDPLWLSLNLDTDIYAPLIEKTNRSKKTAQINSPILKGFLERLEKRLPLEKIHMSGPWYLKEYLEGL